MTDVITKGYLEAEQRARTRAQLDDALAVIRDSWQRAQLPQPVEASPRRTAPGSRPPIGLASVSTLDCAERVLRRWVRWVIQQRKLKTNARHVPGHTATGRQLAEFLLLHTDWLAQQPCADIVLDMLKHQAQLVRQLAIAARVRQIELGRCIEHDCDGKLTAYIRQSDNGLLPDAVLCSSDREHEWAPSQWPSLGRKLGNLDPVGVDRLLARLGRVHSSESR